MLPVIFAAAAERRADAGRARRTTTIWTAGLALVAVAAFVLFPPWAATTRGSLSWAALILLVLGVLVFVRVRRIAAKADRLLGADGELLAVGTESIIVGDTVRIPLGDISGVWAQDRGPSLRLQASRGISGFTGRILLRAGLNTADLVVGIVDVRGATDPESRVHRFRPTPDGVVPGRIELPFGSWFGSAELHRALTTLRSLLPAEVPVRIAADAMDYAAVWADTARPVDEIRARETRRRSP